MGGCLFGALLDPALGFYSLLVPAGITGSAGIVYTCFREQLKKQMKQIEVARVKRDMSEVQEVLERTKSHLKTRRRPEGSGSGDADDDMNSVVELDESLDHALEVLHDLEENVHDLCDDEADLEQVSRTCSN